MSTRLMMVLGSVLLSFTLIACGGEDGDDGNTGGVLGECPPDSAMDQEMGAQVISMECANCHGSTAANRFGAPGDLNFDEPGVVDAQAERMYIRSSATSSPMPPAGGLIVDEIEAIRIYLACGSSQAITVPPEAQ